MQVAGVAGHRIAMLERRMYEAWQASRQCIEVDTPWLCGDGENDDSEYTQGYNAGIIATQNRIVKAGIKIKGA